MTEDDGVYGKPLAIGTRVRWTHGVSGEVFDTTVKSYWVTDHDIPESVLSVLSVPCPYYVHPNLGGNSLAAADELEVLDD